MISRVPVTNNHDFFFIAVADAIRTSLGPKGMDKMVGDLTYSVSARECCTWLCPLSQVLSSSCVYR